MSSQYDVVKLRQKIAVALEDFIPKTGLMPGIEKAVVDEVTGQVLFILKFLCGDSGFGEPQGLLKSPEKKR